MAKSVINTNNLIIIAAFTTTVLITLCAGSAIPMWEYLSRGEKVRTKI